jgi:hypothetical protein
MGARPVFGFIFTRTQLSRHFGRASSAKTSATAAYSTVQGAPPFVAAPAAPDGKLGEAIVTWPLCRTAERNTRGTGGGRDQKHQTSNI